MSTSKCGHQRFIRLSCLATAEQRVPGLVHSEVKGALKCVEACDRQHIPHLTLMTQASGPLWNGAQLAVDTAIVSPLASAGEARSPRAFQDARLCPAVMLRANTCLCFFG